MRVGVGAQDVSPASHLRRAEGRAARGDRPGVLVMIFPISSHPISGTMTLLKVGTAKGQRIRHVGKDLRPK